MKRCWQGLDCRLKKLKPVKTVLLNVVMEI